VSFVREFKKILKEKLADVENIILSGVDTQDKYQYYVGERQAILQLTEEYDNLIRRMQEDAT